MTPPSALSFTRSPVLMCDLIRYANRLLARQRQIARLLHIGCCPKLRARLVNERQMISHRVSILKAAIEADGAETAGRTWSSRDLLIDLLRRCQAVTASTVTAL